MSFFTLPPEINSLRMFLGAGSAPMLEAAAAWDGLAAELGSAADSFGSVISNLAGQAWQGAASAAMAAAAAPYAGWLAAAASQSLGAAGQARSVVSAFEAARAATVHPQAVDANRNAFVNLVMSNLFGQNAPLIAMAESIYEEMWAADVTAMTGYYSGAAAAASQVVPWQTVLQSFPALTAGIAGAVGGAVSAAGAGGAAPAGGATAGAGGPVGTAGAAAAGGGGGAAGAAGAGGSADPGLAPANYAGGDPGSAAAGGAVGTADPGGAGATAASSGAVSPGGYAMMPMPMPMGGSASSAGLLGDRPSMPAKPEEKEEEEATEATAEAEADEAAETPEAEVPAMSVLPTAGAGIAAAAAASEEKAAAQTVGVGIPGSRLRSQEASEDSEATEGDAKVAKLRPDIAPGEFRPRPVEAEEEAEKIQIRGG